MSHVPAEGSGSGSHSRQIARQIEAMGHHTLTLAPAPRRAAEDHPIASIGYPGRPGRWSMPFPFPSFSGHRDSGLLYNDLTDVQLARYLDAWVKGLKDLAQDFRPDVLHVNHAFLLGYCAREARAAPYAIFSHGSEFERAPGSQFDSYVRAGVEGAKFLAGVSGRIGGMLEELAGRSAEVIPPGYDPDTFKMGIAGGRSFLREMGLRATGPVVGYVGRLVPYKRAGDLLHALRLIAPARRPEALFLGSGPDAEELRAAACEGSGIVVHDHLDNPKDVAKVLGALDLVVLPTDHDPFPMVGIEALACGTPVIASDRCGVADLVGDIAGAVSPHGDATALALLIEQALREDWKHVRGPSGPAKVRNQQWVALGSRFLDLYRRTAATR
jgi:glycosyltransferase involved in cell wall biosynthesis